MITDFLKSEHTPEELAVALKVLLSFKSYEGSDEWLAIPFLAWVKLEQLEEFLEHRVNRADLKADTLKYIKAGPKIPQDINWSKKFKGLFPHELQPVTSKLRAIEEALEAHNRDLHNWSTRPCTTCAAITAASGVLFGCDAYRKRDEDRIERLRKRREEEPK